MINLNKEVQYVKNVGPTRVKLLNKLNIYNLNDLITYFPRNYEDRSIPQKLSEVNLNEDVLIRAVVITKVKEIRTRKVNIYKFMVKTEENDICEITFFNQKYIKDVFKIGKIYNFYGKIENKIGKFTMNSPVFDEMGSNKNTGKIIPIYPLTYKLSQNVIRKIIENGIEEVYGNLDETLPKYLLEKYKLIDINEAIKKIHFPESNSDFARARNRLVFEELLAMQLALFQLRKKYTENKKGLSFSKNVKMNDVIETLPFNLTNAQIKVLKEINENMESEMAMNRLLQGDVGSGKTIVSIISAYKAVKSRISGSNNGTYSNTCSATL